MFQFQIILGNLNLSYFSSISSHTRVTRVGFSLQLYTPRKLGETIYKQLFSDTGQKVAQGSHP